MPRNRRALLAIAAVIAVVAIHRDPTGSGGAVRDVFGAVTGLIHQMFDVAGAVTR